MVWTHKGGGYWEDEDGNRIRGKANLPSDVEVAASADEVVAIPTEIGNYQRTRYCTNCEADTTHLVKIREDGVLLKCSCGYSFVDVRVSTDNGSNES